jgi:hypothetical protein
MPSNETLAYRVQELERDVKDLTSKVDRLVNAIIGLALSIAGASVIFALTVITQG